MSDLSQKQLLEAVGDVLREELGQRDRRIDALDQNLLLKSAAMGILGANLAALRAHAENILLRKSKKLSGPLPTIVAEFVE
jgi:hypothetical protein